MSTRFYGYRFPKRDLWHVVDTLRSYFAANHRYARVAQAMEIAHHRRIRRLGYGAHDDNCLTRYLGRCSCDFWAFKEMVRDFVTSKQRDVHGLEGQFIEYGHDYVMLIRGDYSWADNVPADLAKYLAMREVNYNDSTDIPPEERKNLRIVNRFDDAITNHRYFMVPLLTLDDLDRMQWHMAMFFGRSLRAHPEQVAPIVARAV